MDPLSSSVLTAEGHLGLHIFPRRDHFRIQKDSPRQPVKSVKKWQLLIESSCFAKLLDTAL